MGENQLMNLPPPIFIDILARLPPKTVLRCRCVCKAWLHLLSLPEFVDLHLSKSPTCLIVNKMSSNPTDSASFRVVEVEDEARCQDVRYIARMNREFPKGRPNMDLTVIGSIDGLVCINEFAYGYDYELIHVWNPITGEFISVQPPALLTDYPNVTTYGFGISSRKYQVVRIFQDIKMYTKHIENSTCDVYTIGAGLWKNIGHAPYLYSSRERGLFFNGNLHWLVCDQNNPELISFLDLKKESFQPFSAPLQWNKEHFATLNVYKGCLSVCDITSYFDVVIWVMKEYGAKNSWGKEVVISKYIMYQGRITHNFLRVFKVFKDGEVLLLLENDYLFSYHLERKNIQSLSLQDTLLGPSGNGNHDDRYTCIEAQDYVPSFVSLKIGEEKVKKV